MKNLDLNCFGIIINYEENDMASASITSSLKDGNEVDIKKHNASIDAVESLILAHFCAGINVKSPAYLEGLETALQSISDRFDTASNECSPMAATAGHTAEIMEDDSGNEFVMVDGVVIDDSIFDEQMVDWVLKYRDRELHSHCGWINESHATDFSFIKSAAFLNELTDVFAWENLSTGDYVAASKDPDKFDQICESVLFANEHYGSQVLG
jgi:hypothetical protein